MSSRSLSADVASVSVIGISSQSPSSFCVISASAGAVIVGGMVVSGVADVTAAGVIAVDIAGAAGVTGDPGVINVVVGVSGIVGITGTSV